MIFPVSNNVSHAFQRRETAIRHVAALKTLVLYVFTALRWCPLR